MPQTKRLRESRTFFMKLIRQMGWKRHRVADFKVMKCYSGTAEERKVEVTELRQTGRHYRKQTFAQI